VLDEPTNHLDIVSKDILKNALLQYVGTLVIVSHDRDFLQGLTERLYEFKDHKIKEFRGDIFDFLDKRKLNHLRELEAKEVIKNEKKAALSENKIKYERRKELDKKLRKIDNNILDTERSIDKLEKFLAEINKKFSLPDEYKIEIQSGELYKQHDMLIARLNNNYSYWENQQKERENLILEIELVK
jgi:ATP-binding cassette subfamily F protein 3